MCSRVRRAWRVVASAFAWPLVWCASITAEAQHSVRAVSAPSDAARLIAADVDLFVALDDAAAIRVSPVGGAVGAFINGLAGFTGTFEAWSSFAGVLELDPGRAFDDLAGRRLVFVARFDPSAESLAIHDWLILSEVSKETAARVNKRLKPAPRQFVNGMPVLAVEDGRFELGFVPSRSGPGLTLLLAPGGSGSGLLDQVVRDFEKGPARPLSGERQFNELRALAGDAECVLYAKLPESVMPSKVAQTGGPETGPGWIVAAARRNGGTVRAQTIMGMPALDGMRREVAVGVSGSEVPGIAPRRGKPWDPAVFAEIAESSLFASLESNTTVSGNAWAPPFSELATRLGIGNLASEALVTGRMATAICRSETGIVDAAIALESADLTRLASEGDRTLAGMLANASSGVRRDEAPDAVPEPVEPGRFDFGGLNPEAARIVDITEMLGPAFGGSWRGGAKLVWRYSPNLGERAEGITEKSGGWWTVGVGPDAVNLLSSALSRQREAPVRIPWVAMLSAKPFEAIELMQQRGIPMPRPVEGLRWARLLTWYTMLGPGDTIVGGGRVEFAEPPRQPEAQP